MAKSTKKIGGNFVARDRGLMTKDSLVLDLHNARQGNEPGPVDYRGRRYPAGKSRLHRVSEGVVRRKTKKDIMVEAYGNMNHRAVSWHMPEGFKVKTRPQLINPPAAGHAMSPDRDQITAMDSAVGNGIGIWTRLNK